jgi:hypothetical protein
VTRPSNKRSAPVRAPSFCRHQPPRHYSHLAVPSRHGLAIAFAADYRLPHRGPAPRGAAAHLLSRCITSCIATPFSCRCNLTNQPCLLDPRHPGCSCPALPLSCLWLPRHRSEREEGATHPAPVSSHSHPRLRCLAASPPQLLHPLLHHVGALLAVLGMETARLGSR